MLGAALSLGSNPAAQCANPIVCENALPGNLPSEWDITGSGDPSIQGFTTDISVNKGGTIRFKINTTASAYRLDIYRLGYYAGRGARLIATIRPTIPLPQTQPACLNNATTGLNDCGNWAESVSWVVPTTAVSGIYVAKLVREAGTAGSSHVVFVVRDDTGRSDLLFQTSDTTWQAYNQYGGNSLYVGSPAGRAYKVSYNRPITTRGTTPEDWVFNSEYPMVRWLEANGYNVSYASGVDTDRQGAKILEHKVFMSVGHDEYWSAQQRANVEAARNAGVHLAFFSGNEIFWKTRWENSTDASATPYRTLVTYKETHANAVIDPADPPTWTGTWRDPRFSPPADGGRPENALTGQIFTVNGRDIRSIVVPDTDGKMRFWRNTSIATLAAGTSATLPNGVLGYEWDEDLDNGSRPPGIIRMSTATYTVPSYLQDYGSTYATGTATHHLTMYRHSSGAIVLGAGTEQWMWGLDDQHDFAGPAPDVRMQQATVNLFADMGVQPATLQTGLTAATASTDAVAPTSTITAPANGATISAGASVTITGTAADTGGGVVGGVEVSTDGGVTWHPANGRASWTYSWIASGSGFVTIKSRAVDDSGNLETPSAGITITIPAPSSGCPCSIWAPSAVPAGADPDTGNVEIGVKFRANTNGTISGIRFYKFSVNTGTHVGSLWSSTGTNLASVTFTGETASGWQQMNFATPVAITANTTYVASYHANAGRYAVNTGYFTSAGVTNGPLTALQNGVDGGNGVYMYGSGSLFPSNTYNSENYWVDVVFNPAGGGDVVPPKVSAVTPVNGQGRVAATATVTATFNEAMDATTINTNTFQLRDSAGALVPATVTYNSTNRTATLAPTGAMTTSMTYTARVVGGTVDPRAKDVAGNALAADVFWSFTTVGGPDTTPPTVISVTPASGATGVALNTAVTAAFSKAMDATTINTSTFELRDPGGALVASTVTYSSATRTATLQPSAALAATTTYTATVKGGATDPRVKDLAGNALAANFTWSFTTMTPDTTPPTVTSVTPASGATGVATTTTVTATFSEPMDPATIGTTTFELRNPAAQLVAATVTYSSATRTATLTPSAALAASTTYTATVKGGAVDPRVKDLAGNALAANFNWTFTTGAPPPQTSSIWAPTATPAGADPDINAVEVGLKFRSDIAGYITGIRFYKFANNTGTHVGHLWSLTGTLLATATFTGETASGWQQVNLGSPVAITANTTYVVSYFVPGGHYGVNSQYFATAGVDNPPLHALSNAAGGGNGVYAYGASGTFPVNTFNSENYWVDVVFQTSIGPDTTPPVVSSVSPANGATSVNASTTVTATFNEPMDPATISTSSFELRDPAGALVAATVTYDSASRTATLDPTAVNLNFLTTYTAKVKGAGGVESASVKDVAGNAMAADFTWSFTTGPQPGACPCSIWSPSTVPAGADPDATAIEVGTKFQSDSNGFITAIRFYKFSNNTGTHVGHLWSRTGTLLATATFTGETASGWQQVNLASPVAINANTTYITSYSTAVGHYGVNNNYFATGVTNPPLRALASGVDGGNGVYAYGASGTFPVNTFQNENYWVDVVFTTSGAPDTTPPTVTSTSPAQGATGIASNASIIGTFSESVNATTVSTATFELRDPSGALVPANVTYDGPTLSAVLTPTAGLAFSTTYTATLKGGATDPRIKDLSGNAMAANFVWSFTTGAPPPPPPTDGPGGPILVVSSTGNPFSRYFSEMLHAEGLNEFAAVDLSTVTATTLAAYDVVILGEVPLTAAQVTMFSNWVNAGGNLIAMRPDKKLASLLGLTALTSTLTNAYLLAETTTPPAAGIVNQTIQFHGTADIYSLSGATSIATLYSAPLAATPNPAVSLTSVGVNGGQAAAFTYDLARSIVYTRQGNPAWSGQERDGITPIRSDDLFFGASSTDPQPDWVDLNKVAIPQGDEQQRLLANLIIYMNRGRKPLPRFWYFPRGKKAVVVMTGDDHGNGGTVGRFESYKAASPAGCSVANWECIRGTSYIYTNTQISNAQAVAYNTDGFEIALHVNTNCSNWTPATLQTFFNNQLASFASTFPGLPAPTTNRTHCLVWSDYATQPSVELGKGIRLDTNYYYYPQSWVLDRPGFFTGSGIPMRFTNTSGTIMDIYQATTQMTDESGQTYPMTVNTLLDNAIGATGYYGAFTANMHTDFNPSPGQAGSDAIVASAQARGVPVITAKQLLTWLDGRQGSSFQSLSWSGTALTFSVSVGTGANGLQVMLPNSVTAGTLKTLTLNGSPVAFTLQTIKGIQYAIFQAGAGTYQATYGP